MRLVALRLVVSAFVASAVIAVPSPTPTPTASAIPPPEQRVFMVSDSVGLGAATAMPKAFPAGWQVTVVGKPAQFTEVLATNYVRPQPASVFGDIAIVAAGYNYPYWDPARFDRSIDLMVATLLAKGVEHVLWVTVREVKPQYISASAWTQAQSYQWFLPRVNEHLRQALWRHPQLSLIDWASIADRPGLTYDAIHLNTFGAAQYSALAARTALTVPNRLPATSTRVVQVAGRGGVPDDTLAVSMAVTAVNPRTPSFVTVWPCGVERPWIATLNVAPAETSGASTVVPLGTEGTVCVSSNTDTHVVIDVTGVLGPSSGFRPITPQRAVDTRETGLPAAGQPAVAPTASLVGLPDQPRALVLNVTTIGGFTASDVRVHACDRAPAPLAHRRTAPGAVQNLLVLASPDTAGNVCVSTDQPTHVIVDVMGGFETGADVTPLAPARVLDTRATGMAAADATVGVDLTAAALPPAATGAVVVVDTIAAGEVGHVTAWPCGAPRPYTAFVNTLPNRPRTGSTLVALGATSVCLSPSTPMHLVATATGWTGAALTPLTPFRALDTRDG